MKTYVTFGQLHTHRINGHTLDCDCVALVDGDIERVFELFGQKFCFEYPESEFDKESLRYYPRGVIEI